MNWRTVFTELRTWAATVFDSPSSSSAASSSATGRSHALVELPSGRRVHVFAPRQAGPSGPRSVKTLRNRTVVAEAPAPSKGYKRNSAEVIYPSGIGARSSKKRKGMPVSVTRDLLDAARNNSHASPFARAVEPLGGGGPELRASGASRNHILADSRIRNILETTLGAMDMLDRSGSRTADHDTAIESLFHALAGPEEGERLNAEFHDAYGRGDQSDLDGIVEQACVGRLNLRVGGAAPNGDISNQFDPVVVNGAYSEDSARIDRAVRELGRLRLVPFETVIESLSTAKDRFTHYDISSTVLRQGQEFHNTSRVVPDLFAPPASASVRRSSFSEGTNRPPAASSALAPAREFHATSSASVFGSASMEE